MKKIWSKIPNYWLFVCLLILVALFYDYPTHFFDLPKGNHTWRQTDCTSLALNYYQYGMNPLNPRVHHVLAGGADGGGNGVAEFPILYYLTAILYKLFGVHEGIFRLLNFSIFCGGLLALFLLIRDYAKNIYLAFALPLLVLSSPVIGFYSFNFLSDPSALGFSLIGIYNFFRFYQGGKKRAFYVAMACFLMGGLLKITALIPFVALAGLFGLEFLGILKLKKDEKLFPNKWKALIPFLLVFLGVGFWYYTAIQYNEIHQTNYFSTRTWPYWSLDKPTQNYVWRRTFRFWYPQFFLPAIHWFFVLSIVGVLLTPKKHTKLEYGVVALSSIGVVAFFFMWAYAFIDHEYYMINLVYAPILAVVIFFKYLTVIRPKIFLHWGFGAALFALLTWGIFNTKTYIKTAYSPERYTIPAAYYDPELKDFLKEHDIKSPNLAISTPDGSPNSTLYILNLKGWTDLYNFSLDSSNATALANWGTKYLIINDTTALKKWELQPYLKYPIGNFKKQLFFFDLEPYKKEDKKIIYEE